MRYIAINAASDTLDKVVRTIKVEGLSRSKLLDELRRLNPGITPDALAPGSVVAVPDHAGPARKTDPQPLDVATATIGTLDLGELVARAEAAAARERTSAKQVAGRLRELVDSGEIDWKPDLVVLMADAAVARAAAATKLARDIPDLVAALTEQYGEPRPK